MTRPHPYRPPLLPSPATLIRAYTCDMRSLTFRGTRTAAAHHLRGRRWLHAPTTAHCSLFTTHWTYTFSAKERDPETGLSYFGSRYYSSDLSIWLSVDPMSDKYASLSPYVYCADNPVKLVDPDGCLPRDAHGYRATSARTQMAPYLHNCSLLTDHCSQITVHRSLLTDIAFQGLRINFQSLRLRGALQRVA